VEPEAPPGGSIARNAASLLVARGASAVVAFAFGIYVARTLGVAEFGRYSILMAVYALLTICVHLGLESLLVREMARSRSGTGRLFRAALAVKLSFAFLLLALLILAGLVLPAARGFGLPLALIGVVLILDAISDVVVAVFQAHESFTEPSGLGVAGGALFAAIGSALLLSGGRTTSLVAALLAAKALQAAAGLALLARRLGPALRAASPVTPSFALGLLGMALPFFLSKLFAILYLRIDMLMLGGMAGEAPVGLYAAAYKFVNVASAGAAALAAALFPVMAAAAARSPERLRALFGDSMKIMLVAGTLVSALVWAGAERILLGLFGAQYAGGAPAARILGWSIVVLFANLVFSNALLSLGRERQAVGIGALALAVNVGLNLALIPSFGGAGAATATLASELAVAAASAALLARAGLLRLDAGSWGRFLLAAAALVAPMLVLRGAHVVLAAGAGALLYLAALRLLRVLTAGDLLRLRRLLASPGRAA
jgi:O-antigen/teichoic acid export membrane protein